VKPDVFLKTPTIHFEAHSLLDNVLSVSRSRFAEAVLHLFGKEMAPLSPSISG